MQALRTLELIDEAGEPTRALEDIRTAAETDYHKTLQEWLTVAYADIFSIVDPATDDAVRIRDAFRNYIPAGQRDRMVSLFLGLCEEAGIRQASDKNSDSGKTGPRRTTAARSAARRQRQPKPKGNPAHLGLPPALSGLLDSLPDQTKGWTQAERDRFVDTFGAVLDFCYPVRTVDEMDDDPEVGSDED